MGKKKAAKSSKSAPKKKVAKKEEVKVNKTQLIKAALAATPNASPKEIASKVGHGVSAQYVSTIKSKSTKKKATNSAGNGRRKKSQKTQASTGSDKVSVSTLVQAKKLAEQLGGVEKAKAALEVLGKLQ